MSTTTSQKPPDGGGVAMESAEGPMDTTVAPLVNGGGINPKLTTRSTDPTTGGAVLSQGGDFVPQGEKDSVTMAATTSVAPPVGVPLNDSPSSGDGSQNNGLVGTTVAPADSGGVNLGLAIGIPVAILFLILVGLLIFFICWKKKRSRKSDIQKIEKRERNGRVPINGILRDKKISHILVRQPSREGAELYVVRHYHKAEDENQLTLQTGRFVEVVDKMPDGWWRGIIDDKEGWFPSGFVKKIDVSNSLILDNEEDIANANTPTKKTVYRNSKSYEEWIKEHEESAVNGQEDDTQNIQGYLNEIFSIEDETDDSKRNSLENKMGLFESKIAKEKGKTVVSDSDLTDQEQVMEFGSENDTTPSVVRKSSPDSEESDGSGAESRLDHRERDTRLSGGTEEQSEERVPEKSEVPSRQDNTEVTIDGSSSKEEATSATYEDMIKDNQLESIQLVGQSESQGFHTPNKPYETTVSSMADNKKTSIEHTGGDSVLKMTCDDPELVVSPDGNSHIPSSLLDEEKQLIKRKLSHLGAEIRLKNSSEVSGSGVHGDRHVSDANQSDVPSELTHSDRLSSQDDTFDSDGEDDSRTEVILAKYNLPVDNSLQIGQRNSKTYVAMYPFSPSSADQIELSPNDVVYLEDQTDTNGWIRGTKRDSGEQGWFPKSYVREGKSPVPHRKSVVSQDEVSQEGEFDEDLTGMEYQVLYPYTGQQEGDLTLSPDDLVVVLEMLENGWWRGCSRGKEGWFPGTYVEVIPQTPATPTSQDSGFSSLQEPLAVSSPGHSAHPAAAISVSPIHVSCDGARSQEAQDTTDSTDLNSPVSPGSGLQPGGPKPQVPRRYVVPKLVKIQQTKLSRLSKKVKRPTRPAPPVPQKSPGEKLKHGASPKSPGKKHSAPLPPGVLSVVQPKSPDSDQVTPIVQGSTDIKRPVSGGSDNGQSVVNAGTVGSVTLIRKKRQSVERPRVPPPRPPTGPPARRMSEGQVGEPHKAPIYNRSLSDTYSKVVPSWENSDGQTDFALVPIEDSKIMGGSLEEEIMASLYSENKSHLNSDALKIPDNVHSVSSGPGVSLQTRPYDFTVGVPTNETSNNFSSHKDQIQTEDGLENKVERKSFGAHGDTVVLEDNDNETNFNLAQGSSAHMKDSTKAAKSAPSRPEPPASIISLYKGSKTPPPARTYTEGENSPDYKLAMKLDKNPSLDVKSGDDGFDKRTPPPLPPKPDPGRLRTRRSKSDPNAAVIQTMVEARAKKSTQPNYDNVNASDLRTIPEKTDIKIPPLRPKAPPKRAISAGNLPPPRPLSDQLEDFKSNLQSSDMSFGENEINEILLSPAFTDSARDNAEIDNIDIPENVEIDAVVIKTNNTEMGSTAILPVLNDFFVNEDESARSRNFVVAQDRNLSIHSGDVETEPELCSKPLNLPPRMALLPRPVTPPRGISPVKRAKSPRRHRNEYTSPKPETRDSGNASLPASSPPLSPTARNRLTQEQHTSNLITQTKRNPSNLNPERRSKQIPAKPPRNNINLVKPVNIPDDFGPVSSVDPLPSYDSGSSVATTRPSYLTSPVSSASSSTTDLDSSHLRFFTPTKFVPKYSTPSDKSSSGIDEETWRATSPPPSSIRVISPVPAVGHDGKFVSRPLKTDFDTPRPFIRSPLVPSSITLSTEDLPGYGSRLNSSIETGSSPPSQATLVLNTEMPEPHSVSIKKTKFSTSPLQDLSDMELESEV